SAARGKDREAIKSYCADLRNEQRSLEERAAIAMNDDRADTVVRCDPRAHAVTLGEPVRIDVERPRALFSAWYELFPRSASSEPGRHGTFADVEARLP